MVITKAQGSTAKILSGLLAMAVCLSGCSTLDSVGNSVGNIFSSKPSVPAGQEGNVAGFLGGVVADEPQAALIGRSVLSAGGSAADAATAMGFTLAVTLPSRAGLGSSGACLAFDPNTNGPGAGKPEAIMFSATAPANPGSADRPAAVPMLARGLFALQARYGVRPVESLIVPAEQFARFGVPISRALIRDLAVVAGPLSADPAANAVFFSKGAPLGEGATLVQPGLGGTLAQLRVAGVGDLYQGLLGKRLADVMQAVGGGLSIEDLRNDLPKVVPALMIPASGGDIISLLPAPEAGGVATAAAGQVLLQNKGDLEGAKQRALAAAAEFLQGGISPEAVLKGPIPPGTVGPLPASTTFGAIDSQGRAVMCGVSMGNLFGTGRIAPGTGILMAASPARKPQPLLSVVMLTNSNINAFHAMAGGSGQDGAPVAAVVGLLAGLAGQLPVTPPEPGRANVIACPSYLGKDKTNCAFATDPRGFGLATGSF
jgi:gamma-glutamyltranspeptidase/glutathione hydrolase